MQRQAALSPPSALPFPSNPSEQKRAFRWSRDSKKWLGYHRTSSTFRAMLSNHNHSYSFVISHPQKHLRGLDCPPQTQPAGQVSNSDLAIVVAMQKALSLVHPSCRRLSLPKTDPFSCDFSSLTPHRRLPRAVWGQALQQAAPGGYAISILGDF